MLLGRIARTALRAQSLGSSFAINAALKSRSTTAGRCLATVASRPATFSTSPHTCTPVQPGQTTRYYSTGSSDLTHATALVYSAYGRPTEVLKYALQRIGSELSRRKALPNKRFYLVGSWSTLFPILGRMRSKFNSWLPPLTLQISTKSKEYTLSNLQ
jgi:hypothetical protein